MLCSSTGIHHHVKTDSPQHKSLFGHPIQDILPAHRRSFTPEWQKSTEEAEQQAIETMEDVKASYDAHTHSLLPDIHYGSNVTLQNQQTKLWDIYETVVTIEPHRCYHVKTNGRCILVRNRRFLRHHVPASLQFRIPAPLHPPHKQLHNHNNTPLQHDTHKAHKDPAGHPQGSLQTPAAHDVSAMVLTPPHQCLGEV